MASEKLLELLQQQIEQQRVMIANQEKRHQEQIQAILRLAKISEEVGAVKSATSTLPSFPAFDSASELWTDYWARFNTYLEANSVLEEKKAYVFLTNQTMVIYKLLTNLAVQQSPPKNVNDLTIDYIEEFMIEQFHPKRFIVCERFKYWSNMDKKPGKTVQE